MVIEAISPYQTHCFKLSEKVNWVLLVSPLQLDEPDNFFSKIELTFRSTFLWRGEFSSKLQSWHVWDLNCVFPKLGEEKKSFFFFVHWTSFMHCWQLSPIIVYLGFWFFTISSLRVCSWCARFAEAHHHPLAILRLLGILFLGSLTM